MQHNIYLYRNGGAADFIQTDTPRKVIPIRLKTPFTTSSTWYRSGKWEVMPADIEQQILDRMSDPAKHVTDDDKYAYCEFTELMTDPVRPNFTDKWQPTQFVSNDIEDYSADEMARYLAYRTLRRRYQYNTAKNTYDSNNIKKDWYAAEIAVDDETLTLAMTITQFDRRTTEHPNPNDYIPMANPYWESQKCVLCRNRRLKRS